MKIDAVDFLAKSDPILGMVISKLPMPEWQKAENHFQRLVEAIISQQLSEKAADTIYGRFTKLFKTSDFPTHEEVIKMNPERMRGAGISYSKITYIKDLSIKIANRSLDLNKIDTLKDEEVIEYLVQVKGIGRWTAEMFLMFSLGREDIFSYGDLGLRNAIQKLYKIRKPLTQKRAEQIAKKWKPYRSLACRYLWASLRL